MGRLTCLPARFGSVAARVQSQPKVALSIYTSPQWRGLIGRIKRERGAFCVVCGSGEQLIGDHIVEIKDGGAVFEAGNVQLLCHAHHQAKTSRARKARAGR